MSQPDSDRARRRFRSVGASTLVAAAFLVAAACGEGAHDPRGTADRDHPSGSGSGAPAAGFDLLLVTLDTVRADRIGCYGYADAATPVIDALAGRGVRFDQAVAPAPHTLTTHCSIMTGLYPPRHGVRDNGYFVLGGEAETLAEDLRASGYATAAFVSAYVLDGHYGLDQGFDHYDAEVSPGAAGRAHAGFNERPADAVTDASLAWLESHLDSSDRRPYFLWTHYFDPHREFAPPPPFAARFADRLYDGEIAFVDSQIGRLVEFLERRGRLDRTLIVLAADHGEGLGEHEEVSHSLLVYDSTVRVPWILSNPLLFEGGRVVGDRVVSLVDVKPTVLELMGIAGQAGLDGVNALAATFDPGRAVYVETLAPLLRHRFAPLQGLRRLGDKYVDAPRPEYYDLASDPHETENLLSRRPAAVSALRQRLERMTAEWERPEAALARALPLGGDQVERLAALGYVELRPDGGDTIGRDPKDLVPLFNRVMVALELAKSGRRDEALEAITEIVTHTPDEPYAWQIAALLHQSGGRSDRAEEALRRSLALRRSAESHARLAQLLVRRGAYAECAQQLDLAEQLDPHEGIIYITRGDLFAVQGDIEGAIEQFRRALQMDPIRTGDDARKGIAQAEAVLARDR